MSSRISWAAALLCCASLPVVAVAAKPILANGPARTQAEEDANENTAFTWHRNVMGGDRALALTMTDRKFIQHDVEEPSGSEEFIAFFAQPGGPPGPNGGVRSAANAALKAQAEADKAAGKPIAMSPGRPEAAKTLQTRLAAITDGDLTMGIYASRGGDPGKAFGSNLYETKNGKVTQEWYSGPTFTAPPGTTAPTDYSQWYAPPYRQVANIQFLVPINSTTRAQREANKKLVSEFWEKFFTKKKDVGGKYLAADLRNHSDGQPSGAAFAAYARQNTDQVTAPDTHRTLFLMGEGDLVLIGFPVTLLDDPGAWYAQNMVRVKDGKIVEWWYSGFPTGTPTLRYGATWPIGKGTRPGTTD
jgi:predicted SnoaL-like aldol condensation-catalyzing enzyme